eukprot:Gb_22457 [translate_table: standard]
MPSKEYNLTVSAFMNAISPIPSTRQRKAPAYPEYVLSSRHELLLPQALHKPLPSNSEGAQDAEK